MEDRIDIAAAQLRAAYTKGTIAPLTPFLADGDTEGAYEVQRRNTLHWHASGREIVGRKIGLTSRSVQAQLAVSQPDYGVLFDDMRLPNGGIVRGGLLQPRAEAEIALILAKPLEGEFFDRETIADAVGEVAAAIEIVDSRIADWKIRFVDTVADNGSAALFALSNIRRPLREVDLFTAGMVLEVDGEVVSVGAGAATLGHPLDAAAWLAKTLSQRGEPLQQGDIILTGALGPVVPFEPGQQVRAHIGGIGTVDLTYEADQ